MRRAPVTDGVYSPRAQWECTSAGEFVERTPPAPSTAEVAVDGGGDSFMEVDKVGAPYALLTFVVVEVHA